MAAQAVAAETPAGYRMGDYRAPVPADLPGATVVDTAAARALVDRGEALPVFVLRLERSSLPGAPWRLTGEQPAIPGGLWLPTAGLGDPGATAVAWGEAQLFSATSGDRDRGLLIYCLSDCWLSWNAAKRALAQGWKRVYWYPDGLDGWMRAGHPTAPILPPPPPPPPPPSAQ